MGFFDDIQGLVNSLVGEDYRKIYFSRHPENEQYCACCRKRIVRGSSDFTIDHIIPQKYGGTNPITNLQPMCRSCNSSKREKINQLSVKYSGQALIREIRKIWG